MANRSHAEKTTIRLPDDITTWLKQKAEYHVSSMTCEMVRAVRAAMAAEHRERRQEQAQS
jgi:predicted transcriptional regulator